NRGAAGVDRITLAHVEQYARWRCWRLIACTGPNGDGASHVTAVDERGKDGKDQRSFGFVPRTPSGRARAAGAGTAIRRRSLSARSRTRALPRRRARTTPY